jgi:hypothetical protein
MESHVLPCWKDIFYTARMPLEKSTLTTDSPSEVTPVAAREALDSVVRMEGSAWRRAVPPRWFGAGVALLVGSLFALYALEEPYPYIVFPIIGLGVFIATVREKSGAYGRDIPTKTAAWVLVLCAAVLVVVFLGTVAVRRAYDAAWVPVAAGLLVGAFVFWASESERRYYRAKAEGREAD